jgi:hypothetical protein
MRFDSSSHNEPTVGGEGGKHFVDESRQNHVVQFGDTGNPCFDVERSMSWRQISNPAEPTKMNTGDTMKGYDDSAHLTAMADGLITRKYHSVDEAAKAVLGEEGGSNIDRLRRKYREQNWHEKGLTAYVDAEIAKRNLIVAPAHMKILTTLSERLASPVSTALRAVKAIRRILSLIKPDGRTALPMVAATLLLSAVSVSAIPMAYAMAAFVAFTVFALTSWADRSSESSDGWKAGFVLSAMAGAIAVLVGVFGLLSPNAAYSVGSMHGAIALAIGLSIIGVYATSFISTRAVTAGRRKTFEVSALIVALAIMSQTGTAILAKDAGIFTTIQTALQAAR